MTESLCVCQSKKGRTGLCDILPEYQKELAETREELKTLRVELENNSKELEVYKKALMIACSQNNTNPIPICVTEEYKDECMSWGSCGECWANVCLYKAREEFNEYKG